MLGLGGKYRQGNMKKNKHSKNCKLCGNKFMSNRHNQEYCAPKCYNYAKLKRYWERKCKTTTLNTGIQKLQEDTAINAKTMLS